MKSTAWIIGASSGLGRQTAESLAEKGFDVILTSRNKRDLEALSNHIQIKYKTNATVFVTDLEKLNTVKDSKILLDSLVNANTFPSHCFMLSGSIHQNDAHLEAIETLPSLLQNNFTGPVLLLNELIIRKTENPLYIAVASSVAASRARGKNIAYSTAKRALEQYCSGLMHSLAETNTTIRIYRFGYMDTNLSYGQKLPFPAAKVNYIASAMIEGMQKGSGLFYLPRFWFLISFILNMVPFAIYKKLKF